MAYVIKYKENNEEKFSFAASKEELEEKINKLPIEGREIRFNPLSFSDYLKNQEEKGVLLSTMLSAMYFSSSVPSE